MSEAKLEAYFFSALFITVLIGVGILFYPFLGALVLAIVLATIATPLHTYLQRYVKNKSLSALLVTFLVTLAIILPTTALFFLLVDEVSNITKQIATFDFSAMPGLLDGMHTKLTEVLPFISSFDYGSVLQSTTENIGSYLGSAVAGTADFVFKLFITLIALFYFIKDGPGFLNVIIKLSPLRDDEDAAIVHKLKVVTYSLVRGSLVVAFLQGLLMGIGFLIFDVPNPVLWGSIAAISAMVPILGIGAVSIPAFVYLVVTGHIAAAIGFGAWAILIVGLVDNIIGPKLIGSGAKIHPLFVLLSVIGGLALFGFAGFLIGPFLFGLLVALSEIYRVKIHEMHHGVS